MVWWLPLAASAPDATAVWTPAWNPDDALGFMREVAPPSGVGTLKRARRGCAEDDDERGVLSADGFSGLAFMHGEERCVSRDTLHAFEDDYIWIRGAVRRAALALTPESDPGLVAVLRDAADSAARARLPPESSEWAFLTDARTGTTTALSCVRVWVCKA